MGKASSLFNGDVDQTLIGRVTPTAEQREFLQEQWNTLAEHLKETLGSNHGYTISTWLQGSYKYGTLIKPVHIREEYDVDVGVYFHWNDEEDVEPSPKQLRDWVQVELLLYEKTCRTVLRKSLLKNVAHERPISVSSTSTRRSITSIRTLIFDGWSPLR